MDMEKNLLWWLQNIDVYKRQYLDSGGEADSTGTNQYLEKNGMQETETTKQEAMEMYASVKEHGGVYIWRYETGNDGSGKAVVRRGDNVYNNIPVSYTHLRED